MSAVGGAEYGGGATAEAPAARGVCARHAHRWAGRAPATEDCERPAFMVCLCGDRYVQRCQASSRAKCAPCSERYRRCVRRVASSGMVLPGRTYLLTLTAPGDRPHRYRGGWCPCTDAEGVDLARWNGEMANRWNKFVTDVRRSVGECEYLAAKEAQKRGALHLHVPIRFAGPARVRLSKLRALAIRHGFGHEVDLQELDDSAAAERTAGYVAKYVTKASGEREAVPFVHRVTGEVGPGRWRTWSASRGWGASMASVRLAQRRWWLGGGASGVGVHEPRQGGALAPTDSAGHGDAVGGALDPNTVSYARVLVVARGGAAAV